MRPAATAFATLTQLIETVWLQFGPFMRVVYGRLGHVHLHDNHQSAIQAILDRDEQKLRAAIAADIIDGMSLIKKTGLFSQGAAV